MHKVTFSCNFLVLNKGWPDKCCKRCLNLKILYGLIIN